MNDKQSEDEKTEPNWYRDAVAALERGEVAKGLFIALSDPTLYERLERAAEERRNAEEW